MQDNLAKQLAHLAYLTKQEVSLAQLSSSLFPVITTNHFLGSASNITGVNMVLEK